MEVRVFAEGESKKEGPEKPGLDKVSRVQFIGLRPIQVYELKARSKYSLGGVFAPRRKDVV